jgi:hypothetical protein
MPRYVLPVPFLYALGAVSLMALSRTPVRRLATGATAMAVTLVPGPRPVSRARQNNMQYLGIVRM